MSLTSDQFMLETISARLQNQAAVTGNDWNDPVQRRFYAEFIDQIPSDVRYFTSSLSHLSITLSQAESAIQSLL